MVVDIQFFDIEWIGACDFSNYSIKFPQTAPEFKPDKAIEAEKRLWRGISSFTLINSLN